MTKAINCPVGGSTGTVRCPGWVRRPLGPQCIKYIAITNMEDSDMVGDFKTELRDQSLHFAIAFSLLAIITLIPSVPTYALCGFLFGYLREVSELQAPTTLTKLKLAFTNQKLDLTFWTIGGIVAGLLLL